MDLPVLFLCLFAAVIILLLVLLIKVSKKPQDKTENIEVELKDMSRDFAVLSAKVEELSKAGVVLYRMVDSKLTQLNTDNDRKLEQMRQTVDEKLQQTLESRLTTSFKTVSQQLEAVYKQLGEIQTLSKGVGNLEKVLTNVKTRGMWGELQADRILEDILLPEQYLKNVPTKHNSKDPVEFAVKLPGKDKDHAVLMPIDAKFPREDYEKLCEATQVGDFDSVKACKTALERRIIGEAKDIRDKYIDVPYTTDFAVMFLPVEGLYAEVLSVAGLQERLQHEFHVMVCGPATLASLLNSLQMGFRTLAIEKKSSEVWYVLGEVKTQFAKFSDTLIRVKEKLQSATNEVDDAFVRQRAVARKLKSVEAVKEDVGLINEVNSGSEDLQEYQHP